MPLAHYVCTSKKSGLLGALQSHSETLFFSLTRNLATHYDDDDSDDDNDE